MFSNFKKNLTIYFFVRFFLHSFTLSTRKTQCISQLNCAKIIKMIMTVSTTRQQKAKKGNIRCRLKNYKISLRDIEERSGEIRDGKKYHYNTISAAFDKDHKYWNEQLIGLAERMIEEKKNLSLSNN